MLAVTNHPVGKRRGLAVLLSALLLGQPCALQAGASRSDQGRPQPRAPGPHSPGTAFSAGPQYPNVRLGSSVVPAAPAAGPLAPSADPTTRRAGPASTPLAEKAHAPAVRIPVLAQVSAFQSGPGAAPTPLSPHAEALPAPGEGLTRKILEHARARGFAFAAPQDPGLPGAGPARAQGAAGSGDTARLSEAPKPQAGPPPQTQAAAPDEPAAARKARRAYLSSLLPAQMGLEILGLAVPQLATQLSGSFQDSSWLGAAAFAALGVGGLIAGPAVDRFGISRVYRVSLVVRILAVGLLSFAFSNAWLTVPLYIALFALDSLFLGASRVSESVIPTALHGGSQQKVNGFGISQQLVIEGMALLGLTVGEILLASVGFGAALWAYPVLVLASLIVNWRFLRLPGPSAQTRSPGLRRQLKDVLGAMKASPLMRKAFAGYALAAMLTAFVYFTIAPNFGRFAAGALSTSAVTYWTMLLFGAGGLAGVILMAWLDKRQERGLSGLGQAERAQEEKRQHLRCAAGWLVSGALALLGGGAFLLGDSLGPAPAFAAMVPIGLTTAGILVNTETVIKTEAPEEFRGSVMGLFRAGAQFAAALSFPLLGLVFQTFSQGSGSSLAPSSGAFVTLAALFILGALTQLWVAAGLRRAARGAARMNGFPQ